MSEDGLGAEVRSNVVRKEEVSILVACRKTLQLLQLRYCFQRSTPFGSFLAHRYGTHIPYAQLSVPSLLASGYADRNCRIKVIADDTRGTPVNCSSS